MGSPQQKVISYYHSLGSTIGYKFLLKGFKHFGYYPNLATRLSVHQAILKMVDKLYRSLNLPPGSMVLDAGCGQGGSALYLAQKYGYQIEGIDLLKDNIDSAQKAVVKLQLDQKAKFRVGDYTKLPFPNNLFNGIYTLETLVHAPNYQKTLKEFRRLLKPGGKLVLFEYTLASTSNLNPRQRRIAQIVAEGSAMHSLLQFRHGSLAESLSQLGFTQVHSETITSNIRPMLRIFYLWGVAPYLLIKLLHLEKAFVNITAGVEGYLNSKTDAFRYVIVTACKPLR